MKKLLIGLAVLVGGFLAFAATRPSTFQVERSTSIAAPSPVVFTYLNDFRKWNEWSPWEKLDPAMKKTFEGPETGTGAIYSWSGNDQVGEGKMTLVESKQDESLDIKLEFIKPFEATNQTKLVLASTEGGVQVTWTMKGENNFMAKVMSIFMDMDQMIGKDFEQGLANLKTVAEAEAKKAAEAATAEAPVPAAEQPAADEAAPEAAPAPAAQN